MNLPINVVAEYVLQSRDITSMQEEPKYFHKINLVLNSTQVEDILGCFASRIMRKTFLA